ncbi:MAG: glycosyltransferase [Kiritimatiellae bacterium]|nr:glycosyltransferase [Kiritimatiellia bacterium]
MKEAFELILLATYIVPAGILLLFGINLYTMLVLFFRRRKQIASEIEDIRSTFHERFTVNDLPHVVTQIPVYNEYNVVKRIMYAAANMDYPLEKHTLQILDDSTDDTCRLIDEVAESLKRKGHRIEVIRRAPRIGFKAGALENGMQKTDAEYFAIFDADFVPPKDFLKQTIPVMMLRPKVGIVQARWGHLNANRSLLTQAQAIGIDGHFAIEQPARAWNKLFMNFNGTAGLWRRRAIEEGGGWQHDTLTEDMDLSYRSQLAGWKPFFLWDHEVPAELPESINAFKSQQFRWAKGSIQTAIKLLPRVFKSDHSLLAKIQSVFHMTHYLIHPVMLWLSIMALPVFVLTRFRHHPATFTTLFGIIFISAISPSILYSASQFLLHKQRWKRLRCLPYLSTMGVGIAISNSRAVFEAIVGKSSEFVRTPKRGDNPIVKYAIKMPYWAIIEIVLGIYCFISFYYYLHFREYLIGPFLFLYACGFTSVGLLSLIHTFVEYRHTR